MDLERHLYAIGMCIIKFFLHLSKEERRKRFLARIDDADENWKLLKVALKLTGIRFDLQRPPISRSLFSINREWVSGTRLIAT
jgi:hypothetical protein